MYGRAVVQDQKRLDALQGESKEFESAEAEGKTAEQGLPHAESRRLWNVVFVHPFTSQTIDSRGCKAGWAHMRLSEVSKQQDWKKTRKSKIAFASTAMDVPLDKGINLKVQIKAHRWRKPISSRWGSSIWSRSVVWSWRHLDHANKKDIRVRNCFDRYVVDTRSPLDLDWIVHKYLSSGASQKTPPVTYLPHHPALCRYTFTEAICWSIRSRTRMLHQVF